MCSQRSLPRHRSCLRLVSIDDRFSAPARLERPLHPEEHERAMALFGGPNGTSSRKWNALLANTQDLHHVQWARLDSDDDPITKPPESWGAFEELTQAVLCGDNLTQRQEAMLREGIGIPRRVGFALPRWCVEPQRMRPPRAEFVRRVFVDGERVQTKGVGHSGTAGVCDLRQSRTSPLSRMVQYIHHRGRRELRPSYRPLAAMLTWLSTRLKIDRTLNMEAREYVPMMAWSHDIQSRMFDRQPPQHGRDVPKSALSSSTGLVPRLQHAVDAGLAGT